MTRGGKAKAPGTESNRTESNQEEAEETSGSTGGSEQRERGERQGSEGRSDGGSARWDEYDACWFIRTFTLSHKRASE